MTLALSPREEIPWFRSGIGTIKMLVVYHGMARAMRDVAEQPMVEGVAPSTWLREIVEMFLKEKIPGYN